MHPLAILDAIAFDRSVAAEIADRGECVCGGVAGRSPLPENNRRQGRDPLAPERRHAAALTAYRQTHRDEMVVAFEMTINAVFVPQLVERGIQIDIDAFRDRVDG